MTATAARCQCMKCFKYLARDRAQGESWCVTCAPPGVEGIALAGKHAPVVDPLQVEILALIAEESGEVVQRVGKTLRWGWDVTFQGTSMRDKLESEIGDTIAMWALAVYNGVLTVEGVAKAYAAKLDRLREDAGTPEHPGPRERLTVAQVPAAGRSPVQVVTLAQHDEANAMARTLRAMAEPGVFASRIMAKIDEELMDTLNAKGPHAPRRSDPEPSPVFCEHANEAPQACPCEDAGCYCKTHTCRPRVAPAPLTTADGRCMLAPHGEYDPFCPRCDAKPKTVWCYHAKGEVPDLGTCACPNGCGCRSAALGDMRCYP